MSRAFNSSTFNVRQQNGMIERHGDFVSYFPGRKCSCSTDLDTNRGNPNCRVCLGLGYYYGTSQTLFGLVTGITSQKMLMEAAIALPGDMVFSQRMMEPIPATDMDMIRLSDWDGQPYEGDILQRGAGTTDRLVYLATDIVSVAQSDPELGTVQTFVEGTDFTHAVLSDQLVWLNNAQPGEGTSYSVKYLALFDWIVLAPPNQRYERGTPLGNRVLLRKKHIVLRSS